VCEVADIEAERVSHHRWRAPRSRRHVSYSRRHVSRSLSLVHPRPSSSPSVTVCRLNML
jgi:hypothetical protein